MEQEPKTLQDAILYFSDPVRCREYVVVRRWPGGVTCPRCGNQKVKFQEKYNRWQCSTRHDRRQFTVKTGTILEESPLGLDKWLCAMWLVVNCKNGVSSYEIHRALGVTQKTSWFLDHRIRLALSMGSLEKLSGEVEADETSIGGKARNMHIEKRKRRVTGTGGKDNRRQPDTSQRLESLFREQVTTWKRETGHLSSVTKARSHPSYLRIIGLARSSSGRKLERLLLKELESEPDHWFDALTAITGANPVEPEHDFDEAVGAWLSWGRERGII